MKKKYTYGSLRKCIICKTEFRPRDRLSTQKTCSNKCRGLLQTQKATRICPICGKGFVPKRPGYKTCCRKCGLVFKASRRVHDPMVSVRRKLASFCCSSIARCLRNKTDRTYKLLGYSVRELKTHIESLFEDGMTWSNYGNTFGSWSIDHIRPISSFSADSKLSEINALSNLHPLWHSDNCSKGNKWKVR